MHLPPIRREAATERARADRRGFTLIELLVVIAIMAIVLGMTVAIGPGVLRSNAMSGGLSKVASAVSLARSEAVRARKPTIFVLAPTNPRDERSYIAYAIMQGDSINSTDPTNYTYITRWQRLPQGVLFTNSVNSGDIFTNTISLRYPDNGSTTSQSLPAIKFAPGGGLDEDEHSGAARVALQAGVRMSATAEPEWVGATSETNEVVVQRLSGKVSVERSGEVDVQ